MTAMQFPERFNMAWYFLDRNVEEGRGGKTCLHWRDRSWSYAQVQAQYYRQAVETARKQSDVRGLFIFKVFDETRLEGLQSGVRYADGSPKPSLAVVQQLGSGG